MMKFTPVLIGAQPYAPVASVYLLLTGMTGGDPVYALLHGRTCGLSERNRCRTLMYQMKAALGRHTDHDHDQDHEAHALKPYGRIVKVSYAGCWV